MLHYGRFLQTYALYIIHAGDLRQNKNKNKWPSNFPPRAVSVVDKSISSSESQAITHVRLMIGSIFPVLQSRTELEINNITRHAGNNTRFE